MSRSLAITMTLSIIGTTSRRRADRKSLDITGDTWRSRSKRRDRGGRCRRERELVFIVEVAIRHRAFDTTNGGDLLQQLEDVGPISRIGLQASSNDLSDVGRVGMVGGNGVVEIEDGELVVFERRQVEGHAEEENAQGPDVALMVDGFFHIQVDHFGSAVAESGVALELLITTLHFGGTLWTHDLRCRTAKVA